MTSPHAIMGTSTLRVGSCLVYFPSPSPPPLPTASKQIRHHSSSHSPSAADQNSSAHSRPSGVERTASNPPSLTRRVGIRGTRLPRRIARVSHDECKRRIHAPRAS